MCLSDLDTDYTKQMGCSICIGWYMPIGCPCPTEGANATSEINGSNISTTIVQFRDFWGGTLHVLSCTMCLKQYMERIQRVKRQVNLHLF